MTDLYDVIRRRRDTRREFTGDPVPDDVLERLLLAAHAAPSVGMSQPWDFVLVRSPQTLGAFRDHVAAERETFASTLTGERAETFSRITIEGICESGLGVVVGYDPTRGGPQVLGRHAIPDAGLYSVVCAIQNLWLAATVEGLGVGWVSFFPRTSCELWSACRPTYAPSRGCASGPWPTCPGARPGTLRLAGAQFLGSVVHEERYRAR